MMEIILKQTESGVRRKFLAILLGILAVPALAAAPSTVVEPELAPLPKHERIGELVTEFVEKSHYQHSSVNAALSEPIPARYIRSDARRVGKEGASTQIS